MKKVLLVTGAILMMACAREEVSLNDTSENVTVQTVEVNVEPFGNADTKTAVSVTNDIATYSWSAGDTIGIYPYANSALSGQTSQQIMFKINGSGGSTSATFTGTGWGLVTNGDYGYFSYYPYSSTAKYNEVAVSFSSSLNQTSNDDTGHLTGLDRLYAPKIQPESGTEASFTFKHLTALVEFEITVPDSVKNRAFKTMTVTAPSKLFTTAGTYDPSSATDSNVPTITPTATTDKLILSLNGSTGIVPDADSTLHLFFLMAPAAVSGKTLSIKLTDTNGKVYIGSKSLTSNIASQDYKIYECEVVAKPSTVAVDLSEPGTANCYIVPEYGNYMFLANIKGNGVIPTGITESSALDMTGCTAEVIWETANTSTKPDVGDIVKDAAIEGNYITFYATGTQGNALIALKKDSIIVWSWHIWSTNADIEALAQTYPNNAGVVMDRNLGALSVTPNDPLTMGLLYQWGRPSPFPGGCSFDNQKNIAKTTDDDIWSIVTTDSSIGTLTYSTAHPTTFINPSSSNYIYHHGVQQGCSNGWFWQDGYDNEVPNIWNTCKTMYDPCPKGWRTPTGEVDGLWTVAGFGVSNFTFGNHGRTFDNSSDDDSYYPAAGFILTPASSLIGSYVGDNGRYWTCTHRGTQGAVMVFNTGVLYTAHALDPVEGYSIRPCRE